MKKTVSHGLGALAAACAALLADPAAAQLSTTANGPYYAVPSWGQKLMTNRFVVLANWNHEAVLDRETGLVWERTPDASLRIWILAHDHCKNRNVGGRKGWRLPAVQELASLVEPTIAPPGPTLPDGHPFLDAKPSLHWSASTVTGLPNAASTVSFGNGQVVGVLRTDINLAWCVRGGPGTDAQ